ncbi:MAG: hypothetical protein AAGC60_04770 [Acidobacteriota bacterium]
MYLFDLSARTAGDIRLELFGPPLASMATYLSAIEAPVPGWFNRLEALVGDADRLHLSFDLGGDGTVGERIGVEASYALLPQSDPRWSALFKRLETAGLCAEDVAEGIEAWVGQEDRSEMPESWPAHPALSQGRIVRLLSHVKLVGRADGEPVAKIYLLFRFIDWRTARRRR